MIRLIKAAPDPANQRFYLATLETNEGDVLEMMK